MEEEPEGARIRKDINRGAAITFAGNAFKLAEFAFTLLAARIFGVHAWGQYIFLNTFFMPVLRLSAAGMDKGVIWYLARHKASRTPRGFFRRILLIMLALAAILLSGVAAWRAFSGASAAEGKGLLDPLALSLFAMALPFMLLTNLNLGVSSAFRKVEHEIWVRGIVYPVLHLGLPCCLAAFSRDVSLLAACFLAGSAAGWLLSARLSAPLKASLRERPETEDTPRALGVLWSYSWPMGLRDALLAFQQRVDVWCLAIFLSPESLGVYGLTVSIANSIKTVRQAFDTILLAIFSGMRRTADSLHIKNAYLHAGQAITALQTPIFAFLIFFAGPLLRLSGPEYGAGEHALLVFAFTLLFTGYLGLSGVVVLGMGKSRWALVNDLFCLAASVGLNLLLVPRFGILGAAMGSSLAILATNILWYLETIYLLRRVPISAAVLGNLAAGLLLMGGSYALWRRYGGGDLASRALFFSIFALPYSAILWRLFGRPWLDRRRAARTARA